MSRFKTAAPSIGASGKRADFRTVGSSSNTGSILGGLANIVTAGGNIYQRSQDEARRIAQEGRSERSEGRADASAGRAESAEGRAQRAEGRAVGRDQLAADSAKAAATTEANRELIASANASGTQFGDTQPGSPEANIAFDNFMNTYGKAQSAYIDNPQNRQSLIRLNQLRNNGVKQGLISPSTAILLGNKVRTVGADVKSQVDISNPDAAKNVAAMISQLGADPSQDDVRSFMTKLNQRVQKAKPGAAAVGVAYFNQQIGTVSYQLHEDLANDQRTWRQTLKRNGQTSLSPEQFEIAQQVQQSKVDVALQAMRKWRQDQTIADPASSTSGRDFDIAMDSLRNIGKRFGTRLNAKTTLAQLQKDIELDEALWKTVGGGTDFLRYQSLIAELPEQERRYVGLAMENLTRSGSEEDLAKKEFLLGEAREFASKAGIPFETLEPLAGVVIKALTYLSKAVPATEFSRLEQQQQWKFGIELVQNADGQLADPTIIALLDRGNVLAASKPVNDDPFLQSLVLPAMVKQIGGASPEAKTALKQSVTNVTDRVINRIIDHGLAAELSITGTWVTYKKVEVLTNNILPQVKRVKEDNAAAVLNTLMTVYDRYPSLYPGGSKVLVKGIKAHLAAQRVPTQSIFIPPQEAEDTTNEIL